MVDCFDRIAVQMTEIALAPILQLAKSSSTASATVRLPSNGKRVLLTVFKRFPTGGPDPLASHVVGETGVKTPSYTWKLELSDGSGQAIGKIASSPSIKHYPKPEDAFWAAVDALRDVDLGQRDAG